MFKFITENKLLKDNIIYISSVVLGGILGYFFHFILARELPVGKYGEFQALISFMSISGVFFSAFSFFIIKYSAIFASHNDKNGQSNFLEFVFSKFKNPVAVFFILFLLSLPAVKNILHLESYWGLLFVGAAVLFSFYASLYSNSFQGWSNFLVVGIIGVLIVMTKLISGSIFSIIFKNASAAAFSLAISAFTGWAISRYYFRKKWPKISNKENEYSWRNRYFTGTSFKKGFFNIFLFSLGLALVSNLDIMIVKNLASPEFSGYYGALSTLGKTILWINFAVASVLFPDACSDGHLDRPAKKKSVIGSYGIILFVSSFLLLIFYFFPYLLIGIMFGGGYLPIASNLWIFGLMAFALSLLIFESKLALARQDFKIPFILLGISFLVFLAIRFSKLTLGSIGLSVSSSFFFGWMVVLIINIFHRLKYRERQL